MISKAFTAAACGLLACLPIAYFLMKPYPDFDASKDYPPNEVQQEFLKLTAQKYHYVGLGDTNHTRPEIQMFALNKNTVRILSEAGKKNYFLEQPREAQSYFNAVRLGHPTSVTDGLAGNHSWLCSDQQRNSLHNAFEMSAHANPQMNFIAADTRHDKGANPETSINVNQYTKMEIARAAASLVSLGIYQQIYGCISYKAFLIPMLILPEKMGQEVLGNLTDDTKTAGYIRSYQKPAAILFGAGHFMNGITSAGTGKSMRSLLQRNGNNLVVIDIARTGDDEEKIEFHRDEVSKDGGKAEPPDAVLYVIPSADNPDGIEIINSALLPLYEQARANVRQKSMAALRPSA